MTSAGAAPRVTGLCHVGMFAQDPVALAEFYQSILGLHVVGGSAQGPFGATAFLSGCPAQESHHLALFANPAFRHAAFKVRTLADLRAIHQRVVGAGVPIKMAFNHGTSLAFYFEDPERNLIEVYWPTGIAYPQPYGHPIDLTLPEEVLSQDVEDLAQRAHAPRNDALTPQPGR